jgi:hypothetical protein
LPLALPLLPFSSDFRLWFPFSSWATTLFLMDLEGNRKMIEEHFIVPFVTLLHVALPIWHLWDWEVQSCNTSILTILQMLHNSNSSLSLPRVPYCATVFSSALWIQSKPCSLSVFLPFPGLSGIMTWLPIVKTLIQVWIPSTLKSLGIFKWVCMAF